LNPSRTDRCFRLQVAGPLLAACATVLVVACGGGGDGQTNPPAGEPPANPGGSVTISGKAQYEFPPPVLPGCSGLDFNSIELRPIRQAPVQAIDPATQAVLAETVSDDNGDWSLTVDAGTDIFLRVRAEMQQSGSPSWDVQVRDNTSETTLALSQRPIYVLDGATFDSGAADMTRDITAATGWGGNGYTGDRSAAPFAVLDAIYRGMLLVLAEEPGLNFEPLDVFWSVNNTAAEGEIDDGDIGTSFYRSDNRMFLLGMEGVDTEEFDHHVIVHEWGHYFEDTLSRSDSIGGAHSLGDRLDMRVAFGEGWATAYSGMALESPDYCDTFWSGDRMAGFRINIDGPSVGDPGWFNETSILVMLYDLWDSGAADDDGDSIGFGQIYDVMTGPQAETAAFTSIFTFAEALKNADTAAGPFIDGLLLAEGINPAGINAWGDGETNDAEEAEDVLPVYTAIVPDGSVINICSNDQFDENADGNKLSEHRYLRMTVDTAARYTFEIITTTAMPAPDDPDDDRDQSDPDILITLNGVQQNAFVNGDLEGFSGDANEEIFTTANELQPGEYALALVEFRYLDDQSPEDYPPQTCFDVSVRPAT
jgi:hypothetical protein